MLLPFIGPDGRMMPTTAAGVRNMPMVPNPGGEFPADDAPVPPQPKRPDALPPIPGSFANMTDIQRTPAAQATPKSARIQPPMLPPIPGDPSTMLPAQTQTDQLAQGGPDDPVSTTPGLAKPAVDGRTALRAMGAALVASRSPAERIQGLQMLFEASQPTPGEVASSERERKLGVVNTANVDNETLEQARVLTQLGANEAQIAEALGFDAKGRADKRLKEKEASEPQRKAQEAVDKKYADEYAAFRLGGARDAENNLAVLTKAREILSAPSGEWIKPTGPITGLLPDSMLALFPAGQRQITARDLITTVGQRNLKEILGAQFAASEGEAFLKRVFNEKLSPEENMERANRLMTQIERAYQDKRDAADYFEQNGTLKGFKGNLAYSLKDFEAAVEGKMQVDLQRSNRDAKQDAAQRPDMSNEALMKYAAEIIEQGADPAAVEAQLKAWGVPRGVR